jgi:hypothetical protein
LDCADFSSQEEAQEVLEDDPSDPHGWLPTTVKRAKIGGLGRRPGMGTGDG